MKATPPIFSHLRFSAGKKDWYTRANTDHRGGLPVGTVQARWHPTPSGAVQKYSVAPSIASYVGAGLNALTRYTQTYLQPDTVK
jgi:hypothetical protein